MEILNSHLVGGPFAQTQARDHLCLWNCWQNSFSILVFLFYFLFFFLEFPSECICFSCQQKSTPKTFSKGFVISWEGRCYANHSCVQKGELCLNCFFGRNSNSYREDWNPFLHWWFFPLTLSMVPLRVVSAQALLTHPNTVCGGTALAAFPGRMPLPLRRQSPPLGCVFPLYSFLPFMSDL